jgi:hypothetical protein
MSEGEYSSEEISYVTNFAGTYFAKAHGNFVIEFWTKQKVPRSGICL